MIEKFLSFDSNKNYEDLFFCPHSESTPLTKMIGKTNYHLLGQREKTYPFYQRIWKGICALGKAVINLDFTFSSAEICSDLAISFRGKKIILVYKETVVPKENDPLKDFPFTDEQMADFAAYLKTNHSTVTNSFNCPEHAKPDSIDRLDILMAWYNPDFQVYIIQPYYAWLALENQHKLCLNISDDGKIKTVRFDDSTENKSMEDLLRNTEKMKNLKAICHTILPLIKT